MTKLVRFIRDWGKHPAGTVMNLQASLADALLRRKVVEEFKSVDEPPFDKMMRQASVARK